MKIQLCIVAVCALASPALAQDTATGAQITAAISGNTVQGGMVDTGAYTEFYDVDGMIKGEGYTGLWTIKGDTMCFVYGTDPATCYGVAIAEGEVSWILDGAVLGTGLLVVGNPNGY